MDASRPKPIDVDLWLSSDEFDAEQLEETTRTLRSELLDLDVDHVTARKGEAAPSGTRGLDAETIGQLIVGVGPGLVALRQLLETVRSWHSSRRQLKISVRIGEDQIELTDASSESEERLVNEFIRRHGAV
ncbi:effector-associated constant component EACC1 [Rhodococcus aetherivorans]|uniref:effector-associated constant component EACC1 n=1 Tax=Rhodococcus aetherivorans TaxID=191292 RepID=UPI0012608A9D|nr:hypothetical protein [Rhodococcus aetherivorans]NGP26690.1 hypothetical protein [Rhodococcus aetherivorans]